MAWISLACFAAAVGAGSAAEAPLTFPGSVRVFSDRADRVVVSVDRHDTAGRVDGVLDDAVMFTSRRGPLSPELLRALPLRLDRAAVTLLEDGALVRGATGAGERWQLHLAMPGGTDERVEVLRGSRGSELRLWNGAAITHLSGPLEAASLGEQDGLRVETFELRSSELPTVLRPVELSLLGGDDECDSGGKGATGCRQTCGVSAGGGAGIPVVNFNATGSSTAGCSVECGQGFYACCGCQFHTTSVFTGGPLGYTASCLCLAEGD